MSNSSPDIYKDGHIDIAHPIVDKWCRYRLSGGEWQILWVIIRKTWGWHKPWDGISLKQFCEMTDIKKPNVIRAINKLVNKNIVIKKDTPQGNKYHINSHLEEWKKGIKRDNGGIKKDNGGVSKKIMTVIKKDTQKTLKAPPHVPFPTPKETITKETITKESNVEDSIEFRLANFLLLKIKERKPDFKQPKLKDWAKHIDLMIRIDKRSPPQIEKVIEWCQADVDFWQNNILSTTKLRQQFDQLEMKMEGKAKGSKRYSVNIDDLAND